MMYDTKTRAYEEPKSRGQTTLEVLPLLKGRKWDAVALAFVHSLRPSYIRLARDSITLDARTWRVTVWVDENDIIKKIEQEVEVGLPEGVRHGTALWEAYNYGIDSPQCKWHDDDNIDGYIMGLSGYWKRLKDGTRVRYPDPDQETDSGLNQPSVSDDQT